MDFDDNDELLLWDRWPANSWKLYFQKRPSSVGLNTVTCQHAKVGSQSELLKQQSIVLPLYHDARVTKNSPLFMTGKSSKQKLHLSQVKWKQSYIAKSWLLSKLGWWKLLRNFDAQHWDAFKASLLLKRCVWLFQISNLSVIGLNRSWRDHMSEFGKYSDLLDMTNCESKCFKTIASFSMLGAGWVKMSATMVGGRGRILKLHWLKSTKTVPKKWNWDQKINDSKLHICSLSINFRFFGRKSQSQQKLAKMITQEIVSLKKPHSFYEPKLTQHYKKYTPATLSKTFSSLLSKKNIYTAPDLDAQELHSRSI